MTDEPHVLDGAHELAAALTRADRRDIVVTFPGVRPERDWLERLRSAAAGDSAVATVSAMVAAGPHAAGPLRGPAVADAVLVARHSARLRPRMSRPVAGCVLLRRAALDVAAPLVDADPADPAAWLAEFGEHCSAHGFAHLLADDVLAEGAPASAGAQAEAQLDTRFPWRPAARALDDDDSAPLQRALRLASRGMRPVSVTIDGRSLGPHRNGTWVHALELIAALGRTGALVLRVITPPDLDPAARTALEAIAGLTLLPYEQAAAGPHPVTDLVHRPSQVFSPDDLTLLVPLARRVVITQQDLISYRIAGYHDTPEDWLTYRRTTRASLSAADHVVFFSEHARADARADDLIEDAASSVIPIGVDHRAVAAAGPADRPAALTGEEPYLLCLGAALEHKNLEFAVRLAGALREQHGWAGRAVLAGSGSQRWSQRPGVVGLGPVTEAEKTWLVEHAAAVTYPSLYEGFGLVPFEAGAAGTPCLFAEATAMSETLPPGAATLLPWDAVASATRVRDLLEPGAPRDAHVERLRTAAGAYRWDATAAALVALYERLLTQAPREARRGAVQRLEMEARLAENERLRIEEWERYEAFRAEIGADALALVGPDGILERRDQRALLVLLARSSARRPLLAAARSLYTLAGWVLRR